MTEKWIHWIPPPTIQHEFMSARDQAYTYINSENSSQAVSTGRGLGCHAYTVYILQTA